MTDVEKEYSWEELVEQEEEDPGYENFARIDFNLWTDDPSVLRWVDEQIKGIDGHKKLNRSCMMVVILNLYRCWLVDPRKWMAYTRRKGNYRLCPKYNLNRVTWTGLTRCVDHLESQGFIENKLGFFYRGAAVEKGKCSRARLQEEFAVALEADHGFKDTAIRRHPQEETVILKDIQKVPMEYRDTGQNDAAGKRRFLERYNQLLEDTYIDLDKTDYVPKEDMWVDLSRKHVYRVFSNGKKTLRDGGRFYGGWWMGLPGALRKQIIINNMKVVECDYSGIHIYLLYAKEGVDFNALGKDAYQLPDYDQTVEMRNFFKVLLLTAINAVNPEDAKKAITRKVNKKPKKFPSQRPDIDQAIEDFSEYHKPIAHHFFKGRGHHLMNLDSKIAEYVLREMTAKEIPTLSVHDSFICPKVYEEKLISAMRDAFKKHCSFDVDKAVKYYKNESAALRARPARRPLIKIKHEELDKDEEQGVYSHEYMYDLLSIEDEELLARMIRYGEHEEFNKYTQVELLARRS